MAGSTSSLRARVRGLLDGTAGVSPWVIPPGLFHAAGPAADIDSQSLAAFERAYTVSISTATPTEPVNTLSGYALYSRVLVVQVGYALTDTGDQPAYEAAGEQSGAADLDAIEDRADADGVLIRATVANVRNWAGVAGVAVIDITPEADDLPDITEARAVYAHKFAVLSRDSLSPTAYSPTL